MALPNLLVSHAAVRTLRAEVFCVLLRTLKGPGGSGMSCLSKSGQLSQWLEMCFKWKSFPKVSWVLISFKPFFLSKTLSRVLAFMCFPHSAFALFCDPFLKSDFYCYITTSILLKGSTCSRAQTSTGPVACSLNMDHLLNIMETGAWKVRPLVFCVIRDDSLMKHWCELIPLMGSACADCMPSNYRRNMYSTAALMYAERDAEIINVFSVNRTAASWTQDMNYRLCDITPDPLHWPDSPCWPYYGAFQFIAGIS